MEELITERFLDCYEAFEEKEKPSEAEAHFRRIQAIPVLSDAEEADLLQRWCEFRDEKAKDRIVLAHLRMVPPIARKAARKAGFEPNYEMLPTGAKATAGIGFDEVISDLTAAGNLGLMLAVGGYQLGQEARFCTYARQCVRREVWKQTTFLRSAVRRKDGSKAKWDVSIDHLMPDVHDIRDDDVGRRANPSVSVENDGTDRDWVTAKASHARLLPQLEEPVKLNLDHLPKDERLIIIARMRGFKLTQIANVLDLSVPTVWRKEQRAIARIKAP